jgi:A/G-specific adenine glycosylase
MKLTPQQSLLHWYDKNGRHDLPWRMTNDPYPIYISEIMLQQTQVKTVLERFYFPFLERFPTLEDLSGAELDDVLKMWEGLGYYTRARNLHASARVCKGNLPTNAHELMQLPGIGRSTAHAIAAFAYKEPLPIMDANVKRILHRYFVLEARDDKKLWNYAYTLFDSLHPYEYNQAMMDLGSLICVSKKPLCEVCPLEQTCQGKHSPLSYPLPKIKVIKPIRKRIIVVFQNDRKFALYQRRERFLHGLWAFAQYEDHEKVQGELLGHITQHYSHFTLEADVYRGMSDSVSEEFEWFEREEISTLSLSGADHKVLSLL